MLMPSRMDAALASSGHELIGVPLQFLFFGLTLVGVAVFHRHTLPVALCGLGVLVTYSLAFTGLDLTAHLAKEAHILLNLLGLLVGFALLTSYFGASRIPDVLPRFLPDDWRGGFVLLVIVFVLSSFIDNIAAALVGGTIAHRVFQGRVHIGYLAAIVAASNAGGAGSVVGDTTTTMIWIDGHPATSVLHAYIAAFAALLAFGVVAARQQARYQPIAAQPATGAPVDWVCVLIVATILAGAIAANLLADLPAAGVWAAIVAALPFRRPPWHEVPGAVKGATFLLSLVLCASLMPVERLPAASWQTSLVLGVVSAVFDNIPLTKLALEQGGYDWGMLAYAVGFGGSMIWFGSSAGVALSNIFPQVRSTLLWLRHGWHVALAYFIGFFVLLTVVGWVPDR